MTRLAEAAAHPASEESAEVQSNKVEIFGYSALVGVAGVFTLLEYFFSFLLYIYQKHFEDRSAAV